MPISCPAVNDPIIVTDNKICVTGALQSFAPTQNPNPNPNPKPVPVPVYVRVFAGQPEDMPAAWLVLDVPNSKQAEEMGMGWVARAVPVPDLTMTMNKATVIAWQCPFGSTVPEFISIRFFTGVPPTTQGGVECCPATDPTPCPIPDPTQGDKKTA